MMTLSWATDSHFWPLNRERFRELLLCEKQTVYLFVQKLPQSHKVVWGCSCVQSLLCGIFSLLWSNDLMRSFLDIAMLHWLRILNLQTSDVMGYLQGVQMELAMWVIVEMSVGADDFWQLQWALQKWVSPFLSAFSSLWNPFLKYTVGSYAAPEARAPPWTICFNFMGFSKKIGK